RAASMPTSRCAGPPTVRRGLARSTSASGLVATAARGERPRRRIEGLAGWIHPPSCSWPQIKGFGHRVVNFNGLRIIGIGEVGPPPSQSMIRRLRAIPMARAGRLRDRINAHVQNGLPRHACIRMLLEIPIHTPFQISPNREGLISDFLEDVLPPMILHVFRGLVRIDVKSDIDISLETAESEIPEAQVSGYVGRLIVRQQQHGGMHGTRLLSRAGGTIVPAQLYCNKRRLRPDVGSKQRPTLRLIGELGPARKQLLELCEVASFGFSRID